MWAGSRMDNSDAQFSGFRKNLPILFAVAPIHLLLSTIVRRLSPARWIHFSLAFSLIFLTVAHGFHLLKILALLVINFAISKAAGGSKWNPLLTWTWNVGTLFLIEWTKGFKFLNPDPEANVFGGIMRWDVTFNITVLRLISFNLDSYWAHHDSGSRIIDSHKCSEPPSATTALQAPYCCAKLRTQLPHPLPAYSLTTYLAYAMYIPLFFAGPILTFNSFLSQLPTSRPSPLPLRSNLLYTMRLLFALFLMDLFMHLFHIPALTRAQAWTHLAPSSLAAIGFLNLKHIWLKLLIIWRFFRTWSLWDAIIPPENMRRCVSNNYSTLAFWRDWHASFNLWNVRYLYVPLGGARTRMWNTWVIFTFVAVWHDLKLKLFAWGWLIALFMVPELVAKWATRAWWEASGVGFVACMVICLFASSQIMFEIRNEEERRRRKRWVEAGVGGADNGEDQEEKVPLVQVGVTAASGMGSGAGGDNGSVVRGRAAAVNGMDSF
ncbi:MBOAT, membrane-bound O-acyltransferase family-domain-containing protein [Catenaria anguillulae PL171]|uniref:MBOAT, membrane-bound O-acyltransferase family-domain-containing protein n=1 Tax=Catenaria anguillulae PL171 TaxID=765915 RepID=A0A1Y2HTX4_9FUNG|nr:MBOAT, membrane-bound O-acyltransferase family-domain-containing protein [Catenaria anguillulae PL171]